MEKKLRLSRRAALATAAAFGIAGVAKAQPPMPKPLRLAPRGAARRLPDRLIGGSVSPLLDHVIDDPAKVATLKQLDIAYTRFPGGSYSQFYKWRTGGLSVDLRPDSSRVVRMWAQLSQRVNASFPEGVHYPEFRRFADAIGAEPTFMANVETDTVESQTAWMKSLATQGIAPHHVELGSEWDVAMLGDPTSLARWPDINTSIATVKPYADAFRACLPSDVKFGVPIGAEQFFANPHPDNFVSKRQVDWNVGIDPQSWVDALIVHPYNDAYNLSPIASGPPTTAADGLAMANILIAHYDQGLEEMLATIAARAPGKEIWVTEWNPRVGDFGRRGLDRTKGSAVTQALALHSVARGYFTMLRQPAVTINLYFMLNFVSGDVHQIFLPDGNGGYVPTAVAAAIGWFSHAANGGAQYQRLSEPGVAPIAAGGRLRESFPAVEAAHFARADGAVTLVQNAAPEARLLSLDATPAKIETMIMGDFTDTSTLPANVQSIAPSQAVVLPPFSLTRIVWQA